jgi:hypothetical protein
MSKTRTRRQCRTATIDDTCLRLVFHRSMLLWIEEKLTWKCTPSWLRTRVINEDLLSLCIRISVILPWTCRIIGQAYRLNMRLDEFFKFKRYIHAVCEHTTIDVSFDNKQQTRSFVCLLFISSKLPETSEQNVTLLRQRANYKRLFFAYQDNFRYCLRNKQ